jgi:hypothetical protein
MSPSNGDHEWITPAPYVFSGRNIPAEDSDWIGKDDLTEMSQAVVITDPTATGWQVIDMVGSWDGKRAASRRHSSYRHVTRSVHAATCDVGEIERVRKAFDETYLEFGQGPHDYNGYLGEYPRRWPYVHRSEDPITFDTEHGGITFQYLALRQLRGRDWERDYSGESNNLLVPSVVLLGELKWDRRGGWHDSNGEVQIQDPWWWSDKPAALICRTDYMDQFLEQRNRALIILGFQTKFIVGGADREGRMTERTLFVRHQGKIELAGRKVMRD